MTIAEPVQEEEWMRNPHILRVDTSKIRDYLLNLSHAEGRGKAKFFRGVGFSEHAVEEMVEAFRVHAAKNKIARVVEHSYGVKTIVECFIDTPAGEPYCVRAVWNDHRDGKPPRLVTAVPLAAPEAEASDAAQM